MNECEDGDYILHADYAALEARHNALREAVHKAMDRTVGCDKKQTDNQLIADVAYLKRIASDYFKASAEWRCRAFAAEQRYNALREAVAWERECEAVRNKNRMFRNWPETVEAERSYDAARSEVDRLLSEPTE